MKRFFIFSAFLTTIACVQTAKSCESREITSFEVNRIMIYVTFDYDQERTIFFILPNKKYSDQQIQQEIAQRCSICADEDGRLDHIQKQTNLSSQSKLTYIVY